MCPIDIINVSVWLHTLGALVEEVYGPCKALSFSHDSIWQSFTPLHCYSQQDEILYVALCPIDV